MQEVYYSPQFGSANKNSSSSFRNSGAFTTSPGTPDYYGDNNNSNSNNNININSSNVLGGFQKGWCSERVPLSNSSRRHISAAALMPFNSGRTLPSKWDDAERWITSPVAGSGSGVCNKSVETPVQSQERPKAKSGPLDGAPAVAYFSNYSPAVPVLARSPLTAGVIVPDGFLPFCRQDEKDDENGDLRVASRRDMATQMSSESSPDTSPTFMPPRVEPSNHHSARLEVRDVEVDRGVAMTKQSKRHGTRSKNTRLPEANPLALTWNTTEGAMKLSKLQKEEARITAWENLQNAKAEASIRKLEMKLEKKKAASLDKILSKHRAAQTKAEEMRRNMSEDVSPRNSHKFKSLCRSVTNSLKVCFHHHNPR